MIDIKHDQRLVLAYNPRSSRQRQVKGKVFDRLAAAGYSYQTMEVKQASLAENIALLAPQIEANDIVLCVAGDGSAHAVVNSVIASGKPGVSLGFLAFGNFNDLSHALDARHLQQDPVALLNAAHLEKAYPLAVGADGQHLRYALLYATVGWTAKAAAHFDRSNVRDHSINGKTGLVRSLIGLGIFYLKSRQSSLLPEFKIDDKLYHQTDILVANSSKIARLFATGHKFYLTDKFLLRTLDVRHLLPNIGFLFSGLFHRIKGQERDSLRVDFQQPSDIVVQCDGEVVELDGVKTLTFGKLSQPLSILTTEKSK